MATVVTIKVVHMGEDYAEVELSTIGAPSRKLEDEQVSKEIGEWLEMVGAYDGAEEDE